MGIQNNSNNYRSALSDFRQARDSAALQVILSRITGKSTELLSFEEVSKKLRAVQSSDRGLKDIPISSIIGSVGRYTDFTRTFLPRRENDRDRWARVKMAVDNPLGVEPIEVYQIGDAYFVKDGNHRVSVARRLGAEFIQAYVTEVKTKVPFTPDAQPDDLIIMSEYSDFLAETNQDNICPDVELKITVPGGYAKLAEHIQVHQYFMGIDFKRNISYPEAVKHWCEEVYMPVIDAIRDRGILREFPNRTETDLYLWVSDYRASLQSELGWHIRPKVAVRDFAFHKSPTLLRSIQRCFVHLYDRLIPDEFESSLSIGAWRANKIEQQGQVFEDILVGVSGKGGDWTGLQQAILLAKRENADLQGLHVVQTERLETEEQIQEIQQRFSNQCSMAGVKGTLGIDAGEVARKICDLAVLSDIVVLHVAYPPSTQFSSRIYSGFHTLIRRCPRPILAVPGDITNLDRLILAYDGSPKSREALFLSAYFASRWGYPLVVLTVMDTERAARKTLQQAKKYLDDRQIDAVYLSRDGSVVDRIIQTTQEYKSNLILMGGYGAGPVVEAFSGSTVNEVLQKTRIPVFICQ